METCEICDRSEARVSEVAGISPQAHRQRGEERPVMQTLAELELPHLPMDEAAFCENPFPFLEEARKKHVSANHLTKGIYPDWGTADLQCFHVSAIRSESSRVIVVREI